MWHMTQICIYISRGHLTITNSQHNRDLGSRTKRAWGHRVCWPPRSWYGCVMSHTHTSHFTYESFHIWVLAPMRPTMSHFTYELCHVWKNCVCWPPRTRYECVMSHTHTSHVTHTHESSHTRVISHTHTSNVTYELCHIWVILNMNEPCMLTSPNAVCMRVCEWHHVCVT